jgi:hypothetical protein
MADKIRSFVETLAKKTEQNKVNWEKTAEHDVFQASFPSYTIHLFTRQSRNEISDDYYVQIIDEDGAVIEETSDEMLAIAANDPILKAMAGMFRAAKRKALGVDRAVDAIVAALTEGDEPPPVPPDEVQW